MMCDLKTKAFQPGAFLCGAVVYQEVARGAAQRKNYLQKIGFLNFDLFFLSEQKVKEDALVGPWGQEEGDAEGRWIKQ